MKAQRNNHQPHGDFINTKGVVTMVEPVCFLDELQKVPTSTCSVRSPLVLRSSFVLQAYQDFGMSILRPFNVWDCVSGNSPPLRTQALSLAGSDQWQAA